MRIERRIFLPRNVGTVISVDSVSGDLNSSVILAAAALPRFEQQHLDEIELQDWMGLEGRSISLGRGKTRNLRRTITPDTLGCFAGSVLMLGG